MLENGNAEKSNRALLGRRPVFYGSGSSHHRGDPPFITGEFTVTDIKRARLSELFFNENGDRFYKIKVYFITLDEKSGAEKKTAAQMLAQATTLKEAIAVLEDGMKGTLADYTICLGNGNPVDGCIPIRCEQYSRREEKWRGTDSGAKTTS